MSSLAQMAHLASKVNDLRSQLEAQDREAETSADELGKATRTIAEARREARDAREAASSLRSDLHRTALENNHLEARLAEARNELAESRIAHSSLQKTTDMLQKGEQT